ncbi:MULTISPECIES: LLM class F420-dependent oxidoreductase [Mycolicibacterium]|uniref:F420-dependent glucose-6-phosphate dehydrogenase n=1 Tax=Mycolicibacterium mageritense TaxID=53462 RepID=A0AAI8XPL9_MYCME|nr:LLM class F420-dependent oxidoreductase [Mycolicibacterium mageritense]MBN3452706.1 LLM class F420-dependent oxidoreductase [Mycobacterium sp. DSM 3803]OKH83044.1 oxidoreductase [Mycobacterium sp. SWH-M3]TXI58648.1 MAG: LLM class F420-dependent oxidoreductase [Mycolicibacterium mageritense]BDY30087.1 F420-dependent glucose-6-phosphate dehydrogenase [Mycolicibacterium mageritense]GJJ19703.1 LLM class F420-dependent oxidoreductase [Mycolicibacterium mageritense]
MSIRLGLQIPNFSYGIPVADLFPAVKAQAREAEAAGFDTVLLMDHFYQLPGLGAPDEPMLEAYTALGALAQATERVQLSTLVTGNTYRNPTLLAKTITTLDVVSAGRAILGIGAGWFELEHQQLGFDFGTFTERFEKLEEALQIVVPMLHGERPTFSGKWYRTESAINEPRYRDHIPIMLGGSGEKKTFRFAARYADHLNIIADIDLLPGKLDVLRQRCAEIDRDPATLETSVLLTVILDGYGAPSDIGEARSGRAVSGSPEQVADEIKRRVLDVGIDGIILNLPTHGYTPDVITKVGEALRPLVDA